MAKSIQLKQGSEILYPDIYFKPGEKINLHDAFLPAIITNDNTALYATLFFPKLVPSGATPRIIITSNSCFAIRSGVKSGAGYILSYPTYFTNYTASIYKSAGYFYAIKIIKNDGTGFGSFNNISCNLALYNVQISFS